MATKEKLLGVQYLRALAALMVAYFHLYGEIPGYQPFLSLHGWISVPAFRGGVEIFFVISGFVMYVSSIETAPLHFLRRRLARIVPLYWLMTLAVVALALVDHGAAERTVYSTLYLVKSFAFIPYANPGHHGEVYPLLVPGWSLNFEMFFYALFAVALVLERRWRILAIVSTLAAFVLAGAVFAPRGAIGQTYTSPLLILFGIGMIFGHAYRNRWLSVAPAAAVVIAAGGFALLVGPWSGGDLDVFVAAILIVFGTIALDASGRTPHWAFMVLLGDASYSLYLGHTFVLSVARVAWERLGLQGAIGAAGFAVIALAGSVVLAIVTYRLIERPTLALLTARKRAPLVMAVS